MMEPRRISNSETAAWLSCQRKWYYAHGLSIAPKSYGIALNRGIIGHDALAAYYNIIAESLGSVPPLATARAGANKVLAKAFTQSDGDTETDAMLLDLSTLLQRYFNWAEANNTWRIDAVEKKFEVPLTPEFMYVMRLDLLVTDQTGEVLLVDHKFVYDFWQQSSIDMNAQMPKYLGALRFNGHKVDRAVINQIRHRTKKGGNTDDELFKRVSMSPMAAETRQVMKEHIQISEEIVAMRQHSVEEMSGLVKRNMGPMTCRNCSFTDICKGELQGADVSLMIDTYYQPNTYDYNMLSDKGDD